MGNSELWEIGFYGIWKLGGPLITSLERILSSDSISRRGLRTREAVSRQPDSSEPEEIPMQPIVWNSYIQLNLFSLVQLGCG